MGQFRNLLITDVSRFEIEAFYKKELFYSYEKIKSYITSNAKAKNFDFFTRPYQAGRNRNIYAWQSDIFDETPIALSLLKGGEYDGYKAILDENINVIRRMIDEIEQTGANKDWAQILSKALRYGGDDFVFCGNGKVAVAAWSMSPKQNLKELPYYLPERTDDDEDEPDNTPKPQPVITPDTPQHDDPKTSDNPESAETTESTETAAPTETAETPAPTETIELAETPVPPDNPEIADKKPCKWKKWLLWLLLLILLVIIACLLCRSCQDTSYIPAEPGKLEPVNPDDIIVNPDSASQVVSNRLNILLETPALDKFMLDFHKLYPQCRIIYYDNVTLRLQIEVPQAEKEQLKEELPLKMPQYDFIIFDEALFGSSYLPNDPALKNKEQSWYVEAVKAIEAWDKTRGSDEVIVAVVDGGFDLSHSELTGKIYKPYNVWTKSEQMIPNGIGTMHGTHVAGIAVATADNNTGLSGIAPACKLMPVQVGDRTGVMTTMSTMDGILYAIYNGADVINASLGMDFRETIVPFLPEYAQRNMIGSYFKEEERVWNKVFEIAERNNVVIVLAAGNDNILAGIDPMERNSYSIKVSAIDMAIEKAEFSNYGEFSTVSAPGVQIYSSVPGNNYEFLPGTSMAAPIVTGGVALIRSVNKQMPAREISQLLQRTGIPINSTRRIGNLIQLDRALGVAASDDEPTPANDCNEIHRRIDSLQHVIDKLRAQYPDCASKQDTLKLPEVVKKPESLAGRWKSTTSLYNNDNTEIMIYFDFDGKGKGTISLYEPDGTVCIAPLTVSITQDKMDIVQTDDADCGDGNHYVRYTFVCKADKNGYADCIATNTIDKRNIIRFKLVKLN